MICEQGVRVAWFESIKMYNFPLSPCIEVLYPVGVIRKSLQYLELSGPGMVKFSGLAMRVTVATLILIVDKVGHVLFDHSTPLAVLVSLLSFR